MDLNKMTNPELVALYNKHADTPIKRFRDHATAVRRVDQLLKSIRPTANLRDDSKITVLTTENPKRKGSAAYGRFATYRNGMTVREYLAENPHGSRQDIRWDVEHDFIRLN